MATSSYTGQESDQEMEIEPEVTDSKLIKEPDSEEEIDSFGEGETISRKRVDEEYPMINKPRGRAIIFNHYECDPQLELKKRDGTEKDKNRIKEVLEDLGFETYPYDDLTLEEIQTVLNKVAREDDHSKYDCLIIVVMTHGRMLETEDKDQKVVGKIAQICAKDKLYSEEELWKPFSDGKNRSLLNKPKFIFIQSCRVGKDKDTNKGSWFPAKSQREGSADDEIEDKQDFYSIPQVADLLIARSTFDGCYAYRNKNCGSRFIQTLCEELEADIKREDDKKYDLLRILTTVNRNVAFDYPKMKGTTTIDVNTVATKKQMPNFYSTLTRMVYFRGSTKK